MAEAKTMRVAVVRSFMLGGQAQKVGAVLELPVNLGHELIGMHKAERVANAPAQRITAPAVAKEDRK